MQPHAEVMAVLAFEHPNNAVTSVAERMAAGLVCQGLNARVFTLPGDAQALAAVPPQQMLGVLSLGPMPLATEIDGRPLWEHFGRSPVSVYLLDALLYDLARVPVMKEFLADAASQPRLSLISPEAGYRDWLGGTLPVAWRYLPFAAFPQLALPGTADATPAEPQGRFCVVGTIGGELGNAPAGETLPALLQRLLGRRVDSRRLQQAAEALNAPDAHPMPARTLAASLGWTPAEVMTGNEQLAATIAVDSWFKRERRLAAVRSMTGLQVDFFGSGWDQLLGEVPGFRHVGQIRHGDIAKLVPHYLGLVNFDPNWQHGLHDRVYTTTAMGCRIITNDNSALAEAALPHELLLSYDANRPAIAESVAAAGWLDSLPPPARPNSELLARHQWGTRMAQWLTDAPIDVPALPAPAMADPAPAAVQPMPGPAFAASVNASLGAQTHFSPALHPLMHTLAGTRR